MTIDFANFTPWASLAGGLLLQRSATAAQAANVALDADSEAYAKAVLAQPAVQEWIDAAKNEPWLIQSCELD